MNKSLVAMLAALGVAGFWLSSVSMADEGEEGGPRERPTPAQIFERLDADGDGQLTLEEFEKARPPRGHHGPPPVCPQCRRAASGEGEAESKADGEARPPRHDHGPGDHQGPPEGRGADAGRQGPPPFMIHPLPMEVIERMFERIDADENGSVTMEEIRTAREKMIERVDQRADDLGVPRPVRPFHEGGHPLREEIFKHIDTNEDGGISLEEFEAAREEFHRRRNSGFED